MNSTFTASARKESAPPMMVAAFLALHSALLRKNSRNTVIETTPRTAAMTRFSQYECTETKGSRNENAKISIEAVTSNSVRRSTLEFYGGRTAFTAVVVDRRFRLRTGAQGRDFEWERGDDQFREYQTKDGQSCSEIHFSPAGRSLASQPGHLHAWPIERKYASDICLSREASRS